MTKQITNKTAMSIAVVLAVVGIYFYFLAPPSLPDEDVAWKDDLEKYFIDADSPVNQKQLTARQKEVALAQYEVLDKKYNGAVNFVTQAYTAPDEIIAEPDTAAGADVWISYSNEEIGFIMTRPAMSMVVRSSSEIDGSVYLRIMHAAYEAHGVPAHFTVGNVSFGHEDLLSYARTNWTDGDVMDFILEKDETVVDGNITIRTIEHATAYGLSQGYRLVTQQGKPSVLSSYTPVQQVSEMVETVTLL